MSSAVTISVDDDEPPKRPPPPPPKRLSRPKITLSIPDQPARGPVTAQIPMTPRGGTPGHIYWDQMRFHGKAPMTPGSHVSDPHYFNPFVNMYHNKASEFMFKQFEGFKDFTIHTAKSGLSVGEKTAFWLYNKLRSWSKKWFTHLFLSLCLVLYSVMGAAIFMTLEDYDEDSVMNCDEYACEELCWLQAYPAGGFCVIWSCQCIPGSFESILSMDSTYTGFYLDPFKPKK